ncbi:MAG: TetR/AcrR family transcriptional regulator [Actinomycetota bacterium]|nr:TetR/AcrR family transcriptional regulator [Actinomycetota bacterium]
MEMVDGNRLSRNDWARRALEGIARGGVDAVSVEGLARELAVTKGSFYWHFADRADLIGAALELWEQDATLDVIDEVSAVPDVRARLARLFEISFGDLRDGPVDAALVSRADDPLIGPVVERVNEMRLGFLEATYRELGLSRLRAARQARIAYSAYLGHFLVRRAVPGDVHLRDISAGYMQQLLQSIVPSD